MESMEDYPPLLNSSERGKGLTCGDRSQCGERWSGAGYVLEKG